MVLYWKLRGQADKGTVFTQFNHKLYCNAIAIFMVRKKKMQILDCSMQDFTAEIHLVCVIHAKMADSELRAHILSRFWQYHQLHVHCHNHFVFVYLIYGALCFSQKSPSCSHRCRLFPHDMEVRHNWRHPPWASQGACLRIVQGFVRIFSFICSAHRCNTLQTQSSLHYLRIMFVCLQWPNFVRGPSYCTLR